MDSNLNALKISNSRQEQELNSIYESAGEPTGFDESNEPNHCYETAIEPQSDHTFSNLCQNNDDATTENIIRNLIEAEHNYVKQLETSIADFHITLKSYRDPNLQTELAVFLININKLFKFHEETFLPQLIACQFDAFNIAQVFHTNLVHDNFYDYVSIIWDKPKFQELSNKYKATNVFSFDIWTMSFQQLQLYKTLFSEILKINANNDSDLFRAFDMMLAQLKHLIDTIEDAHGLNYLETDGQFNVHQQGKLRKCSEFNVSGSELPDKFFGKVFLFENSLLFTEGTKYLTHRAVEALNSVRHVIPLQGSLTLITLSQVEYNLYGNLEQVEEWTGLLREPQERAYSFAFEAKSWDEQKYVSQLVKSEQNFITTMNKYKTGHLAGSLKGAMEEFSLLHESIIQFHTTQILPILQNNDICMIQILDLFESIFQNETIENIYGRYTFLAGIMKTELKQHLLTQKRFDDVVYLPRMLETAVHHLRGYKNFFGKVVKTITENINDEEDQSVLRSAAKTQVEVNRFVDLITDNYKIHMQFNATSFGSIKYSDRVYDKPNRNLYRIFLMDYAVIALDFKEDPKNNKDEIFTELLWSLLYKEIKYRDSHKIDERIKMYSKSQRYPEYSVIFRSSEKKKQFIKQLMDMPDYK